MMKVALYARLEAKPGKEEAVRILLEQALSLANRESATPVWFALRFGPTTFGIFDAFTDESGRRAHLAGEIAKALMIEAPRLLASTPEIFPAEVIGAKVAMHYTVGYSPDLDGDRSL